MGKSSRVQHEGIVKSISTQTLEVSIISHSACSGCHAKSACGIADMKELSRLNVPGKSFVRETK
jgi:positive regulator of sigma E activity